MNLVFWGSYMAYIYQGIPLKAETLSSSPFPNRSIYQETLHTVSFVQPFLADQASVLDVGCGQGYVAWQLSQMFNGKVSCVDINDFRRVTAPHFLIYDGIHFPFSDNQFDVVLLAFILHHVPDLLKPLLLQEVKRVARGTIVILEDTPQSGIDHLMNWCHGHCYRRKMNRRQQFGFLIKEEWESLFSHLGLSIIESKRLGRLCRSVWQPFSRSSFILKP